MTIAFAFLESLGLFFAFATLLPALVGWWKFRERKVIDLPKEECNGF